MKIKFLGTAAAEGFPAVFCNCKYCKEARMLKGKNIRTRSQSLINDDLLIDIPADTYHHFLENDIEGDKIKYLLITHSHQDHFYPEELNMRTCGFAKDKRTEILQVYFGEGTQKKIMADRELSQLKDNAYNLIKEFETINLGKYDVTALPAKHFLGDGALIYIIKEGDKAMLYAHDTGYFYEEVFDYIKNEGLVFDLVSLDCTNIDIPVDDDGSHMGLPNIKRAITRLKEIGAINSSTKKIINHFSHNANPIQHILEEKTKEDGYIVAYDGLEMEI